MNAATQKEPLLDYMPKNKGPYLLAHKGSPSRTFAKQIRPSDKSA